MKHLVLDWLKFGELDIGISGSHGPAFFMHLNDATTFKRFMSHWLPVLLFCLLIFIQSSFPAPEQIPTFDLSDKLIHAGVYAVLAILFFRALHAGKAGRGAANAIILAILFTTLYGVSDEIHQYFVPSRHAEVMDAAANFIGSVAGGIIATVLLTKKS